EDRRVLAWAAERGERVDVRPGYVPVEDVAPLFAQARVVALPYLAAYQSGVAHLAMTMERAIVATGVGDLPAAVRHGRTGLVVAPRDPAALAAALEDVVTDASLAQQLGREGRRVVMNGSGWPSVAAQVETAMRGLREHPRAESKEERP